MSGVPRRVRLAVERAQRRLTRRAPMSPLGERLFDHEEAVAAHLRAKYPEIYGKGRP